MIQDEISKEYVTCPPKGSGQTNDEQYLKHLRFYNKALQNIQCQLDALKEIVLNGGGQN